jgi:GTP-binding protein EngB required for normal cell division
LGRLAAIVHAIGSDVLERDAAGLSARIAAGRFYVACVGQFKRGKSSVLNALVGAPVLPTGILPVTAVPTIMKFAPELVIRVDTAESGWNVIALDELVEWVSEERNPENRRGVLAVEIGYPSPILARGLCLVDTPGIGSTSLGNTQITRDFVPQIDVALVVVGVDPPLSGEELDLIAGIARDVADIIVVLNKADRFTTEECAEASSFADRLLAERLGRETGPILEVSATEQLAGGGNERDWALLVNRLAELAAGSRLDLVRSANERGVARLVRQATAEVDTQRAVLVRPLTESERRLEILREVVDDAAQRALELSHLFAAEEQRLSRVFGDRREEWLRGAIPAAFADFASALALRSGRRGPAFRRDARAEARRIAHAALEPWLVRERENAEREYVVIAKRFIAIANDFLDRIQEVDLQELQRLPEQFEFDVGMHSEDRYHFQRLDPLLYGSNWQLALDWVRSRQARLRSVEHQMLPYLRELLAMNSTSVESDLHRRIEESRRKLQGALQEALGELYHAGRRALSRARELHAAGEQAVAAELVRLESLSAQLLVLR